MQYKNPIPVVDVVIKTREGILLIKRKLDPFRGKWAIPGGHINYGETTEEAAVREAREETGLDVQVEKILGVYSNPERDPRGHRISIVYLCKKAGGVLKPGSDSSDVRFFKEINEDDLAFDHAKILRDSKLIRVIK
jgi:8-oxo-dGTP diphosphatase